MRISVKSMKCQYCAETLAEGAVICRHCNRKQRLWEYPYLLKSIYEVAEFFAFIFMIALVLGFIDLFGGLDEELKRQGKEPGFERFSLGLFYIAIFFEVWLMALYFYREIIKERKGKHPTWNESVQLNKTYDAFIKHIRWGAIVSSILILIVVLLGLSRPSLNSHIEYLNVHTNFVEQEIIDYYETGIYSVSIVSTIEGELKFVGLADRFFELKLEK